MTLKQLAEIYDGKIEILLDKSFGELVNFKIEASSSDIKYLDIKDNEISKICDIWWYDNKQVIKIRLLNVKNHVQDNLKVKDLVEVLGDFEHKDYTEQCMKIYDFNRKGVNDYIESIGLGRFDNYLNDTLKKMNFYNYNYLRIYIDKEEKQDV